MFYPKVPPCIKRLVWSKAMSWWLDQGRPSVSEDSWVHSDEIIERGIHFVRESGNPIMGWEINSRVLFFWNIDTWKSLKSFFKLSQPFWDTFETFSGCFSSWWGRNNRTNQLQNWGNKPRQVSYASKSRFHTFFYARVRFWKNLRLEVMSSKTDYLILIGAKRRVTQPKIRIYIQNWIFDHFVRWSTSNSLSNMILSVSL